jgi:hypothetical protein
VTPARLQPHAFVVLVLVWPELTQWLSSKGRFLEVFLFIDVWCCHAFQIFINIVVFGTFV